MGANLMSGMGRAVQSRIDNSLAGRVAMEVFEPGSTRRSNLDTRSSRVSGLALVEEGLAGVRGLAQLILPFLFLTMLK